jgi:hypothetical protein
MAHYGGSPTRLTLRWHADTAIRARDAARCMPAPPRKLMHARITRSIHARKRKTRRTLQRIIVIPKQ